MVAMKDCNSVLTPSYTTTLGLYTNCDSFNGPWKYSTVLSMLVYLAGNYHPDITFAIHQCENFTHVPRQSRYKSVKHIICIIKGTKYRVWFLNPLRIYRQTFTLTQTFPISGVLKNMKIPFASNHATTSLLCLWAVTLLGPLRYNINLPQYYLGRIYCIIPVHA